MYHHVQQLSLQLSSNASQDQVDKSFAAQTNAVANAAIDVSDVH
jgi:hypothetical protein